MFDLDNSGFLTVYGSLWLWTLVLIRGMDLSSFLFPLFIFLYRQIPRTNTVRKIAIAMTSMTEFAREWILVFGLFNRSLGSVVHTMDVFGIIKDFATWKSVSSVDFEYVGIGSIFVTTLPTEIW